jgi:hypothetical protein
MPTKKRGRGRPKGSLKGSPHNLAWWRWTLDSSDVEAFIERGDKRHKMDMKYVLNYLKTKEPRFFEKVNGKEILRRLK